MNFNIQEVEMKWLDKCYVAKVHSPTIVDSVQDRILEAGVTSVRVFPMGGSQVLLKPVEGEDLEELINNTGGFLENWFNRIVKWSPMEVPRERYTWIRCQGIPLHAWTAEFFESIVSSLGRFITLDDNTFTFNMKRFDMARIQILASSPDAVHKVQQARINGLLYSIRIVEELFPVSYEACPAWRKVASADDMSASDATSNFSGDVFSACSFPSDEEFQIQKFVEGENFKGTEYLQDAQNKFKAIEGEDKGEPSVFALHVEKPLQNHDESIKVVSETGVRDGQPILMGLGSYASDSTAEHREDSLLGVACDPARIEDCPTVQIALDRTEKLNEKDSSPMEHPYASGENSISGSNCDVAPGSKDLAVVPFP